MGNYYFGSGELSNAITWYLDTSGVRRRELDRAIKAITLATGFEATDALVHVWHGWRASMMKCKAQKGLD